MITADSRAYSSRLPHRRQHVSVARQIGLHLRQTYSRLSKKGLAQQGRYACAQQLKRARKETRKLRIYFGRVLRNLGRFTGPLKEKQTELLSISQRIYQQKRHDRKKIYSLHAPEVSCIAKGKAHKKYEFGSKLAIVTTSKECWVVAIDAVSGNPYDGTLLKPAIKQMEELTGKRPKEAFVDRGFRGSEHPSEDVAVCISGRKKLSRRLRRLLRRRAAIEPVIGHTKQEHGLKRNHLIGAKGDRINAMLSGCAWNLKKLMRALQEILPLRAAA